MADANATSSPVFTGFDKEYRVKELQLTFNQNYDTRNIWFVSFNIIIETDFRLFGFSSTKSNYKFELLDGHHYISSDTYSSEPNQFNECLLFFKDKGTDGTDGNLTRMIDSNKNEIKEKEDTEKKNALTALNIFERIIRSIPYSKFVNAAIPMEGFIITDFNKNKPDKYQKSDKQVKMIQENYNNGTKPIKIVSTSERVNLEDTTKVTLTTSIKPVDNNKYLLTSQEEKAAAPAPAPPAPAAAPAALPAPAAAPPSQGGHRRRKSRKSSKPRSTRKKGGSRRRRNTRRSRY
jgi:hypothetical protein